MWNLFIVALLSVTCDVAVSFAAPTLVVQSPTHQESITITKGQSVRLQCRGGHPISWTYPTASLNETRLTISNRYSSIRGNHVSVLSLENATSADTGFYGCRHEIDADVSDVSSLYVFVTDPQTLFVTPDTLQFVGIGPNRTNIIPCLVNNPSTQVSLVRANGEEELRLNGDIVYDPRLGFSLLYPNVYFNGQFKCRARFGPVTDERRFILHYFATTAMPRPHIVMKNKELTEGNRLKLTCRTLVAADTLMIVRWTKDGEPIESTDRLNVGKARKRVFNHEELRHGYIYAAVNMALSIPCLRRTDSGEYRCTVEDHNGHTNSQSVRINVERNELNAAGYLCL